MAVYYKFKSAKDYDSIPIDGHFISVANLKEKIFESKHLGRGTDVDLVVTNTQTNEDYCDEATMIAKHTAVVVRRVPGRPRMAGGRVFERKTPPAGYICHRCKSFGHFIQHCPTNGDPDFDIKKLKRPTGIPKSMLMETPDGSYALPSGAVAALKPNEAAFEKEIEGLPSTCAVSDISAENAGSLLQPQQPLEKGTTTKATDVSEATHESMTVKETTLEGCAALVEEEAQQKPSVSEPEKKKKKVRLPLNEADLQWRTPQDVAAVIYGIFRSFLWAQIKPHQL